MILDNKVDSLPLVMKVMAIVPSAFGSIFLYFGLWQLGVPLLMLVLMAITAQQRVKVDFENKLIKNYIRILGIDWGKWEVMKEFSLVSITRETFHYREINYAIIPSGAGTKMYEFRNTTVVLNLKINNKEKYVIAKGNFDKIIKTARQISAYSRKDIFDCTLKTPQLIQSEWANLS